MLRELKPEAGVGAVNRESEAHMDWHDLSWMFIGVRAGFFLWVGLKSSFKTIIVYLVGKMTC